MPLSIDNIFAQHLHALQLGSRRMEVLAANVANTDTPGYLARDIDFRGEMQKLNNEIISIAPVSTLKNHSAHIGVDSAAAGGAEALYRTSVQPSLDGNTVDTDRESAAVAETAVRYEAALMLFNSKIRGLRLAITGNS